jgi:hypothetical protein
MHGEYGKRVNNVLFYKTDNNNETVNSHSAGFLEYIMKRLLIFEELSAKKTFNGGEFKPLTGGNADCAGHKMRSDDNVKFTWSTLFVTICNQ